jgi:hypothetical protein
MKIVRISHEDRDAERAAALRDPRDLRGYPLVIFVAAPS